MFLPTVCWYCGHSEKGGGDGATILARLASALRDANKLLELSHSLFVLMIAFVTGRLEASGVVVMGL